MLEGLLVAVIIYCGVTYAAHFVATIVAGAATADTWDWKPGAKELRRSRARATKTLLLSLPFAPVTLPMLLLRWLDSNIYTED